MTAPLVSASPFSGSYRPGDVEFLLKPIAVEWVDLATKERLIQTGQRHYSELLSPESLPSPRYLELFEQALAFNLGRMAQGVLDLAAIITNRCEGPIVLVSLARAGTPIGVALRHVLNEHFQRPAVHYSVSIIRDRGIDRNALRYLLDRYEPDRFVFIDGWTGKGVIARELRQALADFACETGIQLNDRLYTLTDLAGVGVAPSDEDYLIPSSILNTTISGLISRSILNDQIGLDDFHGCVYYTEFAHADRSVWFIEQLLEEARALIRGGYRPNAQPIDPRRAQERTRSLLATIEGRFGIQDLNRIKPGIGEATRVLLRRLPERVIVRDPSDPAVAHLLALANEKDVPCQVNPELPYRAVSLIRGVADA
ncbi:cysteine protease StiP family protein [Caldichromatium japonicum]|uniref:Cysteine protease StiP family protein n=1 Tax=Caldichromatium japonicum TaxID=2699430 RepID=A0A6G7VFT1_9GAMM|nr:cysteine protease StiP family protein [Caldichromatium japonicum]QIK38725.1 cysteine protease StiP family protein [Caldichromatium japonicum]